MRAKYCVLVGRSVCSVAGVGDSDDDLIDTLAIPRLARFDRKITAVDGSVTTTTTTATG